MEGRRLGRLNVGNRLDNGVETIESLSRILGCSFATQMDHMSHLNGMVRSSLFKEMK